MIVSRPNLSMNSLRPVSSTAGTRSGSTVTPSMTSRVSYLFVGSAASAAFVLIKYTVAMVGLPKSSKIVSDVEFVKLSGSFGLNWYPSANFGLSATTGEPASKFTARSMLLVAFGSPDVTGSCKGTASDMALDVTEPSSLTG